MIFGYNITIAIFAHASASAKALWWFENGMPRKSQSDGREMGHKRALEFSPAITLDTCRMEAMLIDIREREQRLRATGHTKAADAYMDSFLSTLDSVNPSLASQLKR